MLSILIVEDDHAIRDMLKSYLLAKNYLVKEAQDGDEAQQLLGQSNPDLILLDWMLPDISGPELISYIRQNPVQKEIPIIMLTARAEEDDKIQGLDAGADDYLTKPVSLKELHARIRALIRRAQGLSEDKTIRAGIISLNPENHVLKIDDNQVEIGQTELRLLQFFMRKPDRVFSRSQLLDQVWGQGTFIDERTIDVHILRLRKTLKPFGVDKMVQTVRGAGYRFTEK